MRHGWIWMSVVGLFLNANWAHAMCAEGLNDPLLSQQSELVRTGVLDAVRALAPIPGCAPASTVRIGILSGGVEWNHEDLRDRIRGGASVSASGVLAVHACNPSAAQTSGCASLRGPNGALGTRLAGVAAASAHNLKGIAGSGLSAELLVGKLPDQPAVTSIFLLARELIRQGARILISDRSALFSESQFAAEEAYARANGAMWIIAPGGNGSNTQLSCASCSFSLVVGGLNDNLAPRGQHDTGPAISLWAPAETLWTTMDGTSFNRYEQRSGVVYSPAFVAGVAALVLRAEPTLSVDALRSALLDSAEALSGGRRLVRADLALERVRAPRLVRDLADVSMFLGERAELSAEFTGPVDGYRWYRNGQRLEGVTGPAFEVLGHADFSGDYRVEAFRGPQAVSSRIARVEIRTLAADFNQDGSVDSADLAILLSTWNGVGIADLNGDGRVNSADLALFLAEWGVRASGFAPRLISSSGGGSVDVGAQVAFRVRFYASPLTQVRWYKDGLLFESGVFRQGFDEVRLELTAAAEHAGRYRVELRNTFGTVVSPEMMLTVRAPPSGEFQIAISPGIGPRFEDAPTAHLYENMSFYADLPEGVTPTEVEWFLDGRRILDLQASPIASLAVGAQSPLLTLVSVRPELGSPRELPGLWWTSQHVVRVRVRDTRGRQAEAELSAFRVDAHADAHALERVVQLSARFTDAPARVEVSWPIFTRRANYSVKRKELDQTQWITFGSVEWIHALDPTTVTESVVGFVDRTVTRGRHYEYEVTGAGPSGLADDIRLGYVAVSAGAGARNTAGRVALVVDRTIAGALAPELERFRADLSREGFTPLQLEVDRHQIGNPEGSEVILGQSLSGRQTVRVRERLRRLWLEPQGLRSVVLIGRVPVPYSGGMPIAGHLDVWGAHPSDFFYGELRKPVDLNCAQRPATESLSVYVMNSAWTDCQTLVAQAPSVIPGADPQRLRNIAGDGKFDQNTVPGREVQVSVGRIDFSQMFVGAEFEAMGASVGEVALLRRYFEKNHGYRSGEIHVPSRALVVDLLGGYYNTPMIDGLRNSAALVGHEQIVNASRHGSFFPILAREAFTWVHGAAGGSYSGFGAADSAAFARYGSRGVFFTMIGSYFGDWDVENNFLRAPIAASGNGLVSLQPHLHPFFAHRMAVGETIGDAQKHSFNSVCSIPGRDPYRQPKCREPQTYHESAPWILALMGDPTLKQH
jgi:hypothetical protein